MPELLALFRRVVTMVTLQLVRGEPFDGKRLIYGGFEVIVDS
jgi:uncharacterized protein YbaA (DUF1428 family)